MNTENQNKLDKLPAWLRYLCYGILILSAGISAVLLSSCGPITKVVTRTTDTASVSISINQPSTNDIDNNISTDADVNFSFNGKSFKLN